MTGPWTLQPSRGEHEGLLGDHIRTLKRDVSPPSFPLADQFRPQCLHQTLRDMWVPDFGAKRESEDTNWDEGPLSTRILMSVEWRSNAAIPGLMAPVAREAKVVRISWTGPGPCPINQWLTRDPRVWTVDMTSKGEFYRRCLRLAQKCWPGK